MLPGATGPGLPFVAMTIPPTGTAGAGPILKFAAFDVPPKPAGFTTVRLDCPGAAISAAGMVTFSEVLLANVVDRGAPFQRTTEPDTKLAPVRVTSNSASPAFARVGEIFVMAGASDAVLSGTARSHMLRPWVPARSVREARCSF